MKDRTHTALRLGAIALLAAVCMWPRSSERAHAGHGVENAQLTARSAPRVETTAAKLSTVPRTVKLVVADADDAQLTN